MHHKLQVHEVLQEGGDHHNDHQGREHQPKGSHRPPGNARLTAAHKGGGVDGDDAGGALAHGVVVRQLALGGPLFVLHQLPLEDGQHGIASAEGTHPDPGEGQEQIDKQVH